MVDINTFVLFTVCLDKSTMWNNYTQILPLNPHLFCTAMAWLYSTCPLQTGFCHLVKCMESSFVLGWVTSTVWVPLLACVNAKRHLGTFQVLSITKEAVVNTHRQVGCLRVPCGIKLLGSHTWPCHFPLIKSSGCFTSQAAFGGISLGLWGMQMSV